MVTNDLLQLQHQLLDASFVVTNMALSRLLEFHRFINGPSLKSIAAFHGVRAFNVTVPILRQLLIAHKCNSSCEATFYAFKCVVNARRRIEEHFVSQIADIDVQRAEEPSGGACRSALPANPKPPSAKPQIAASSRAEALEEGDDSNMDHLRVPSKSDQEEIIRKWQMEMSIENLTQVTCAVCAKRTFKDDVSVVDPRQINLELLRNDKLPKHVLPRTYNFVDFFTRMGFYYHSNVVLCGFVWHE
ncbi:hypothetical protein CC2G_001987 [Coprinopsis cinerea AmutBmut pab1-1]|nr:hypothetical protein CC2G_001987 [Coprinopsis cinerea AmutBmut pab1-1]